MLHARLRGGRASGGRGAAGFLAETCSLVREGGATGDLVVRADSGFHAHAVVAACRRADARFSISVRQDPAVRRVTAAIP